LAKIYIFSSHKSLTRANLKRRKLLFKAKTQLATSNSEQGGNERYNTVVDGQMHNGDAKIADLVKKTLTNKRKNQNGRE